MFVVLLKFSANRDRTGEFMEGHKEWLQRGFDDGVFLLAGGLEPGLGGGIVDHDTAPGELEARVNEDPFVIHDVVTAEIVEIAASRADPRLEFLLS